MTHSPKNIDSELEFIRSEILSLDPDGARIASVIRDTIDQLYDGQRTGRYRWDQLYKTEKTHCGTLIEINLQREFHFADGIALDFTIAGIEIDCKYSQRDGGWMIPPEAVGKQCMLITAEDSAHPSWSLGIIRAKEEFLNVSHNRDGKTSINRSGRDSIQWIWRKATMDANVLLQIPRETVDLILSHPHGTTRVNELFRQVRGKIITRTVIATVNQGRDFMKRIRANGGARSALQKEGILILGPYHAHTRIAEDLGLPIPSDGEAISIRVVQTTADTPNSTQIAGAWWREATEQDPIEAAPNLPTI